MLTVILANCVTLAMQSNKPGFEDSSLGQSLKQSNYVFIAIFMFEAMCKIIALGFVLAEYTYLRNGEGELGLERKLPSQGDETNDLLPCE